MASARNDEPSEVETFLPNSESKTSAKYKINVISGKKGTNTTETVQLEINGKPYDPFKERRNPNPTTDSETLMHLLKASLGSGILSMPYAFYCAGLATGLLATIATAVVCTYCSYVLVKCAHKLYYRARISKMSYPDIAEVAFANGPKSWSRWSRTARVCVMWCLFITYFGAISCYTVIAGQNFQEVIEYYTERPLDKRFYIFSVLPPLTLLSLIPNLKALAPFSAAANTFMATGLGITLYKLIFDTASTRQNVLELRQTPVSLEKFPSTFSITVFAMEAIGLMMPLENNMKNPTHFLGLCGVLNRGMSVVSMVYILVGVIGYSAYGNEVAANITKSLPVEDISSQIVKILIGVSVIITYVLQFFVCLEIGWSAIKDRFVKQAKIYNTVFRMLIVCASVLLALLVPEIGPFVSLIGAFCFSFLGIIFPIVIELATYWETTSSAKLLLRNSPVLIFGFMALCFGTYTSLQEIVSLYTSSAHDSSGASNQTIPVNGTDSVSQ